MNEGQAKFIAPKEQIITQITTLEKLLRNGHSLKNCTLQGLDLRDVKMNWRVFEIKQTLFLGCHLTLEEEVLLRQLGANIIQRPDNLPYDPFRSRLYQWQELHQDAERSATKTVDLDIYDHFSERRFNPSVNEALWQRIHDHAMDDALRRLLAYDADGMTEKKCVAVMGGHGTLRTDPFYRRTVETTKLLAEQGYFIVSGGGPGIMEAANLGAYLAGRPDSAIARAIELLAPAPSYDHEKHHETALAVLEAYPDGQENLAIPTWFYGHEPSNLFASHIAKYFSNSIREDTLLAVALYGIIFAPGSAGTTQEIFMDAAQNHYATFNYYSPMIFLGKKRYEIDTMIFPLLRQLAHGRAYYDLLHLTDDPEGVLQFLKKNPPIER